MHDDLLDGVQWAIDKGITAKDRVAIMGLSYGGYSTLVGLSFTPDTFQCGVDLAGPSNLVRQVAAMPDWWTWRSEEHTSELQSLMRISYAVFCLKKKTKTTHLSH